MRTTCARERAVLGVRSRLRTIYDEVAFRRPCTKCYRSAVVSVLSGFAVLATLSPDVGLRLRTLDRSLTQK